MCECARLEWRNVRVEVREPERRGWGREKKKERNTHHFTMAGQFVPIITRRMRIKF